MINSRMDQIYSKVLEHIDIGDDMFNRAKKEYENFGNWLNKNATGNSYLVYPQGSFALGTVIRPISNSDDYDLDMVCELQNPCHVSARELKYSLKSHLLKYGPTIGEIEEKKRCWHVEYQHIPHFHMDVIPSASSEKFIMITDHNEPLNTYRYLGSNPKGYREWFYRRSAPYREWVFTTDSAFAEYRNFGADRRHVMDEATLEKIKRQKIKTPLQKAIQILKRHRDVMYESLEGRKDEKPISIIITTIAASLYNQESSIYESLYNILNNATPWIYSNVREGKFFIENPSYNGENFADKWNDYPERARAFFEWVKRAKCDLIGAGLSDLTRVEMGRHIRDIFGETTMRQIYEEKAKEDRNNIEINNLKIDSKTGNLSTLGVISIPASHHYGNKSYNNE